MMLCQTLKIQSVLWRKNCSQQKKLLMSIPSHLFHSKMKHLTKKASLNSNSRIDKLLQEHIKNHKKAKTKSYLQKSRTSPWVEIYSLEKILMKSINWKLGLKIQMKLSLIMNVFKLSGGWDNSWTIKRMKTGMMKKNKQNTRSEIIFFYRVKEALDFSRPLPRDPSSKAWIVKQKWVLALPLTKRNSSKVTHFKATILIWSDHLEMAIQIDRWKMPLKSSFSKK